jgi:hypothetical protein
VAQHAISLARPTAARLQRCRGILMSVE